MILEIEHIFQYKYSDYVHLNPHYFYLTPKLNPYQRVLSSELLVLPNPDKLVKNIDQEDNIQHVAFVNTPTKSFEVKSVLSIESLAFNTYDFIFFPFDCSKIPFKYPGKINEYSEIYFKVNPISRHVKELGDRIANEVNYDTLDFLSGITSYISTNLRYVSRECGEANLPEDTLFSGEGSCRDFSVLMMALCLSQNLLTRFVSGYLFGTERHQHDLHAWVDVFLPGGGWRGFDPTEGQAVNKNYIALANSFEASGINPLRGSFRSSIKVESILETNVVINEIT